MSTLALLVLAGGARTALAQDASGAAFAAPPPAESRGEEHASRAHQLEALGKTLEAAREYEAAFAEGRDAEALYHLAICRRDLGDYKAAREALRGYLREEPDGPLRDEVERQLAQLAVLIEARGLRSPDTAKTAVAGTRARHKAGSPPGSPPHASVAPGPSATTLTPAPALIASAPAIVPAPAASAMPPPPAAPILPAPSAAAPPAAESAALLASVAPAAQPGAAPLAPDAAAPARSRPPGAAPGIVSDEHQAGIAAPSSRAPAAAAPESSVQAAEPPALRERLRPASPWLAGGGLALAAAGAALCIGAHQIASDLDARFAAGDLTQADLPRYSKSRAEWISGAALLGLGALAAGAALVLAW